MERTCYDNLHRTKFESTEAITFYKDTDTTNPSSYSFFGIQDLFGLLRAFEWK
jgi:hypothetical protein